MRKILAALILSFAPLHLLAQTTVSPGYTDGEAVAAAQAGISNFSSPNLMMPNAANLTHTIYGWASSTGVSVVPSADTSVFGTGGAGSLTMPDVGFFQNAQFDILAEGIGTTGLANVSTLTFKIKLGSTAIATATTGALPALISQIPVLLHATCTVLATGASGQVFCTGSIFIGSGLGSFTPAGTFIFTGSPSTINLTSGATWDVTAALSSAIGSPSVKFYTARIIQTN